MSPFSYKKNISALLLTLFSLVVCFVITETTREPKSVSAMGPNPITYIANQAAVPTGDQAAVSNTAASAAKEYFLDGIVTSASKVVISNLTQSIVSWINSGFQGGGPGFVTDPEAYFTDMADQIAGDFIFSNTKLGFMCEPFSIDVKIALNLGYNTRTSKRNFCRLSEIVQNTENYVKFTTGDFSQGGWESFFEISQNPANNAMGAHLISKDELRKAILEKRSAKVLELNFGDGFLSSRDCLERDSNGECTKEGPIKTPGATINDNLSNVLGTGFRQLELADEFNEIVGALVGQLVQTVLSKGLTSFSQGGQNYNSLGTGSDDITVSCSPEGGLVDVGDYATWRVSVIGDETNTPATPTTYKWSGEGIDGDTAAVVDVIYQTPGIKTAAVEVTTGDRYIVKYKECVPNILVDQPLP